MGTLATTQSTKDRQATSTLLLCFLHSISVTQVPQLFVRDTYFLNPAYLPLRLSRFWSDPHQEPSSHHK